MTGWDVRWPHYSGAGAGSLGTSHIPIIVAGSVEHRRHTPAILHTLECVNTARLGEILTISFINNTDVTWPAPSHLRQCLRYESNPLTLTVWQAELDIFESFRKQSKPQYGGSGRSCPDSNGFTGHREVLLLQTENTRRHSITNNATT